MRKALVVGIDHYEHIPNLRGCVNDARAVGIVLEVHSNGDLNFETESLLGHSPQSETDAPVAINTSVLRSQIKNLFRGESEISLFYFAGHGHVDETGGYLFASDAEQGYEGIALSDVITWANNSEARNRIIVLDSCHSGAAGSRPEESRKSEVKEGTTILTASTKEQYAKEKDGSGVFTRLFVDALNGAAANLVGEVTPGGVYAHIDQSLGVWEQRPVFKTNVQRFVCLRQVKPPISKPDLRRITEFFDKPGTEFALDPTFEPERGPDMSDLPNPDPVNTEKFAILQKYNRVNLVVPVDAPHMWHAAMGYKSCKLTALGEHYRRLVAKRRI